MPPLIDDESPPKGTAMPLIDDESPVDGTGTLHRCKSADELSHHQQAQQQAHDVLAAPTTPLPRHRSQSEGTVPCLSPTRLISTLGLSNNRRPSFMQSFFDVADSEPDEYYNYDVDDTDDDSGSRYFDKADFLQANWENAVEYIPPMGFAVVAGGLALLFHPVVFLAGALTAFGTVHAVGATYDFCADGALCHLFEQSTTNNNEIEDKGSAGDHPQRITSCVSEVTFAMTDEEDDQELNKTLATHFPDEEEEKEKSSLHRTDPSELESTQSLLQWVQLYYPTLPFTALEEKEFFGLNAMEFFEVFFANDAPYTFEEFQKKRQDKDIQYGQWETLEHVQQPSLHGQARSSADLKLFHLQERVLKFKAKTNSYFGPPYATTTKVQRALVASKKLLVLESKTTLTDIPFCDRFHVMERWVVTAEKKADEQYHASLSIYAQVVFTKPCPFESQIKSQSTKTFLDIAHHWSIMAQEALILTEEARFQRLLRTHQQPKPHKTELLVADIEVQHSGSNQSSIVGEHEPRVPDEEDDTTTITGTGGTRRVVKRTNSIGTRMSRSFSKYVRNRSLSSSGNSRSGRRASADVVSAIGLSS